ncbi:MAG: hypothetical protein KC917_13385 [Candidatus Omnitrophica bacterium]|nr:hypothetical protein [Candidatus Omnitrophota bacterium]MCA9417266.1 hypothetical protein [Candidatus Omnitrophota bacterium]MCA9428618.1 hypothetical protein [Candidatus Omnitrophota bacterium]MCA9438521.1 hypothetical protein [Candidatus Omnitrophota bacterium]MCA9443446.1 hypothetical protein [Candidatus Omnitrophota bacterium]
MRENKNESLVLHQSGEIVQEHRITLSQLAAETGCEVTLIEEMVRFGIIEPVAQTPETLIFPDWTAGRIGKAVRLRQAFDLDSNALGLVLDLLDRIDELEERMRGWKSD